MILHIHLYAIKRKCTIYNRNEKLYLYNNENENDKNKIYVEIKCIRI